MITQENPYAFFDIKPSYPIQPNQQKTVAQHRKAAEQFEAVLLQMMLKSMRQSVYKSEEPSNALSNFQSMYDQKLAENMAKQGGLGLARMLIQDMSKLDPKLAAMISQASPQGKLPIQEMVGRGISSTTHRAKAYPLAQPSASQRRAQLIKQRGDHIPAEYIPRDVLPTPAQTVGLYQRNNTSFVPTTTHLPAQQPLLPQGYDSQKSFIAGLLPRVENAAQKIGVKPEVVVAHAALESGWGKHAIRHADGRESFNLFGIKATDAWRGKVVKVATTEYVQGIAQRRVEKFRAYDSYEQAFDDYARLLTSNPRYQQALNQGTDGVQFAKALQRGGYATDPRYAEKLGQVFRKVDALGLS